MGEGLEDRNVLYRGIFFSSDECKTAVNFLSRILGEYPHKESRLCSVASEAEAWDEAIFCA